MCPQILITNMLMAMLTDRYRYLLITNMFTVIYLILITGMLTDMDYDAPGY